MISSSVVSFADTASRTCTSFSEFDALRISGTTFCAGKLFFGSSSTTKSFFAIAGEVVKMFAAVTSPFASAATVAGPPPSAIATKFPGEMTSP